MGSYAKYGKDAFIALVAPVIRRVRQEGGALLPSVSIAQSWLETGGNVPSWNNLGGYKVGGGKPTPYWDGSSVNTATREVYGGVTVNTTANWRAYKSIYDFYKDQNLLFGNPRYARVRTARTPQEQAGALQESGYATDPQYADKLVSIIGINGLTKYDAPLAAEEDKPITAEEKQAFDALANRVTDLETRATKAEGQLTAATQPVPAPDWFVKEFGSADLNGVIDTPKKPVAGWEAIAVSARLQGLGKGAKK